MHSVEITIDLGSSVVCSLWVFSLWFCFYFIFCYASRRVRMRKVPQHVCVYLYCTQHASCTLIQSLCTINLAGKLKGEEMH